MRESELVLPWAGRGHGDLDAPHADADQGAELQQFQSDRAAGGVGALAPQESNDIKGLFQTSITETYAISMTYVTSAPTPRFPAHGRPFSGATAAELPGRKAGPECPVQDGTRQSF